MSIYDQLTGFVNRGPQRTQALYGILENIGDTASYFLSPRGRQAAMNMVEVGDMLNPVGDTLDAMQMAGEGDYVGAMVNVAGVAIPAGIVKLYGPQTALAAAKAIQETLTGTGDSLGQVGSDVYEAFIQRMNQPGEMPAVGSNLGNFGKNGGPPMLNTSGDVSTVNMPEGSLPQYTGAAPNRTEPYQRYRPKKTTDRMQRLEAAVADPDNPINQVFDNYIEKGKDLAGPDWYNTEELRDWFVSTLGEKEGDAQWREYMELIGTTSTGAKVPQNIRMASFYRALSPKDRAAVAQIVKDEGITPKAAAARLGVTPKNTPDNYAYGHLKQRNQAGNVVNREAGTWDRAVPEGLTGAALSKYLQANPKVKGFGNDLLGDDTNIAADMHFMRMLAMADGGGDFLNAQAKLSGENAEIAAQVIGPKRIKKYTNTRKVNGKPVSEINLFKAWQDGHIKDTSAFQKMPTAWADTPKANEYAAYEDMANRVAETYGMTPAQFQASLWMGAGDMTGLADESQGTFMNLFRRSLDKRAEERGLSREEMLLDFLYNKSPLAVGGMGVLGGLQMQNQQDDRGI
ncbi:MAG: hypothetical protein ACPG3T_03775 [Pseudomonadales bacterium]